MGKGFNQDRKGLANLFVCADTTYKFQRCLYIFPGIRALRVQLIKFKGVPFGFEGPFLSSAGMISDKS